jgi:hypothetical protein
MVVPQPLQGEHMALTILGLLCGIVLSFRFSVLILIPTILFGWMLTLAAGLATGSGIGAIAFDIVAVTIALQLGYGGGIAAKWAVLTSQGRPAQAIKEVRSADGAL